MDVVDNQTGYTPGLGTVSPGQLPPRPWGGGGRLLSLVQAGLGRLVCAIERDVGEEGCVWIRLGTRLETELLGGSFSWAETSRAMALQGPALVPPARDVCPVSPQPGWQPPFWTPGRAAVPGNVRQESSVSPRFGRKHRGCGGGTGCRAGGQGQVPRGPALSA